MFIGDHYPYVRSWGPCPLHLLLQLHSSLSNSEDRPCSRGRDMECRSGSPGSPPWAPGGGLRGLKSQFSARVGDSHSLTHALVFLPPSSLPLVLCSIPTPSPGPLHSISPSPGSLIPSPLLESYAESWIPHTLLGYNPHALSLLHFVPPIPFIFIFPAVPDSIWGPLRKGFRPL